MEPPFGLVEHRSVLETSADNNMIKMLTRVMYGDFTFDLTDHFSSDIVDPSPLSPRIASSSPSSIRSQEACLFGVT
ncbi:hypothetical protein CDAR_604631 [Caerostris darwini]|uniref:Uncharacterized protein n=1 Tax=Caerostris darwini TaxID=1538125 RepID=A0AAV4MTS5_9ARAC|nr:hypothetical protein CDAR_604631 [Caerostris darwini]